MRGAVIRAGLCMAFLDNGRRAPMGDTPPAIPKGRIMTPYEGGRADSAL